MKRTLAPLAAIVLAVACGGQSSTTQPSSTASAPAAAATSAAASRATATAGGPKLVDVVKGGALASYKVSYTWSTSGAGQSTTSQQTWYYKPPKARYDLSIGQGGSFSIFLLEDGTYFCTSSGGSSFCQKTSDQAGLQQNQAADFDLQIRQRPDQFDATYQGTRTIAGQQAQCFGVSSHTVGASGDTTACYSSNGVPLLWQSKSQGQEVTMEATSFSTTVTDADFSLPAPVR
jgi:hypothetical protein